MTRLILYIAILVAGAWITGCTDPERVAFFRKCKEACEPHYVSDMRFETKECSCNMTTRKVKI